MSAHTLALTLTVLCSLPAASNLAAQPAAGTQDTAAPALYKRENLWGRIESTRHQSLPPYDDIDVPGLLLARLRNKVEHASDFRPSTWKKWIHRRAVVAKAVYRSVGHHACTGLWNEPAAPVLLRLSLTYDPARRGVAPGIAIKFLVDGNPSRDVSLLTGLDSQGQDYRFFKASFSNVVPPSEKFGARMIARIFDRVDRPSNRIGVGHLGCVTASGQAVSAAVSPLQIFARGPADFSSAAPARDIRLDFLRMSPRPRPILEIYARPGDSREDFEDVDGDILRAYEARTVKIGELWLESGFVASSFGDDQLFFRHERF